VGAEWVATQQAPQREVRAAQDPESLDRLGGITRAGRRKPARPCKKRRKKQLVCADEQEREALGGGQR
jgi:hypothetical protein